MRPDLRTDPRSDMGGKIVEMSRSDLKIVKIGKIRLIEASRSITQASSGGLNRTFDFEYCHNYKTPHSKKNIECSISRPKKP